MNNAKTLQWMGKKAKKHFLLLGMVVALINAFFFHRFGKKGGPLRPEYSVSYGCVAIIFLFSGITLPTSRLKDAIGFKKVLNATIVFFCFVVMPGSLYLYSKLLSTVVGDELASGAVVIGCMPSTISMCVILSQAAGANEAVALSIAMITNLGGIVVSPLLLTLLIGGGSGTVDYASIFLKLSLTVALPLLIGQLARLFWWDVLKRLKIPTLNKFVLILVIYSTLSNSFASDADISVSSFLLLFGGLLLFQLLMVALLYWTGRLPCLGLTAAERVPLIYCGHQKTIALGIPLITIVFEGSGLDVGLLTLPLLVYHPMQLVLGTLYVGWFQSWMENEKKVYPETAESVLEIDQEACEDGESVHPEPADSRVHPESTLVKVEE